MPHGWIDKPPAQASTPSVDTAVPVKALQLVVEETNGSQFSEVIEIRVYG
ncbi:hypothetical protein U9M73_19330 [Paenibacillus phoenicis]|jgi:hypothetical protein|uniref:Uncharacterized protein n=1 Tax=Paenibacillus phoenicis TaxID=554117 RepID=A0ABU5PQ67_9BACL|nr:MULTISPECIES: hypothetical protein [Paenibacillus]MCT2194266.1 hypothetical protein [Paenibacillus sp. p3-SID1389]MEA3572079.1 hypothetical protein [Paenibacillus phoenicis]MEC2342556.1 hypothetical protein [Paenibacillus barengoltzii]